LPNLLGWVVIAANDGSTVPASTCKESNWKARFRQAVKNLAPKGIFGVRVPLRFFISFRLNKNQLTRFFTDQ